MFKNYYFQKLLYANAAHLLIFINAVCFITMRYTFNYGNRQFHDMSSLNAVYIAHAVMFRLYIQLLDQLILIITILTI